MIVECVQHLADFVEPIHEAGWLVLVGEADAGDYVEDAILRHVSIEPEGGTLEHADGLLRPPAVSIVDPLETCHEEVASEPLVELLHRQARGLIPVGC